MDDWDNSTNFTFPFPVAVVNATRIFFPTESEEYLIALRVLVTVTCISSIIGSGAIILTYICFPDIRTLARQLLVNLSIADFTTALSILVGLLVFYDKLLDGNPSVGYQRACLAQGVFAVFATQSSILWTIAIAVYMFAIIVLKKPSVGKKVAVVSYVVCWGIPLVLTVWLAVDGFLGYETAATPGFCAIRGWSGGSSNPAERRNEVYPIVVGYEMWLYIAFIVLPVLYIAIKCHIKVKLTKVGGRTSLTLQSAVKTADRKLIFVPLLFMVLRVWSIVVDTATYYLPLEARAKYLHSYASAVFGALEGIGTSGQGAANGILFCLFTQIVRHKLLNAAKCVYCRNRCSNKGSYLLESETGLESDERDREEDGPTIFEDSVKSHARPLLNVSSGNGAHGYSAMGHTQ